MENSDLHPALKLLAEASKKFPGAWHYADFVRSQERGIPKNCYLPIEFWEPHLEHCGRPKLQSTAMQDRELSLLGGWRPRQDIVTVPPFLYQALFTTDIDQALNGQVFRRLPAWTVFFDLDAVDSALYGFFAGTLCGCEGEELFAVSFLPKPEYEQLFNGTRTLSFKICDLPLVKAIEAQMFCPKIKDEDARLMKPFLELFMPMISVTMFLCVYGFDGLYEPSEQRHVSYPQPKRTKKGWRLFPPPKPTVHELGTAIEARLAEAMQARDGQAEGRESGTHASPRAHIRRGHWHGYWHGSGKERKLIPHWLPPLPINVGSFTHEEEEGSCDGPEEQAP